MNASASPSAGLDDAGTRLAHYDVLSVLGRGVTGIVFETRDRNTDEIRAVKLLRPDADLEGSERRSRFLREARTTLDLHHPNIARVHEVGEIRLDAAALGRLGLDPPAGRDTVDLPYIAMERVAGEDLSRAMLHGLELEAALDLLHQVLDALEAAHGRGVVHRDLKPGNVMVTPEGRVKLLDFGLAKRLPAEESDERITGSQLTLDGMVMGSLPYLAPEQLQGDPVRRRSDLFSLGVLGYELFTGERPFPGGTMLEFARALLAGPPTPPSVRRAGLPPWIDDWLMPLLALDPDERPASARVAREALERGLLAAVEISETAEGNGAPSDTIAEETAPDELAPSASERPSTGLFQRLLWRLGVS